MSSTTLDARGDTAGEERLSSWTVAAACLLLVAGGFNVIQGYTLLEHKSYLQTQNVVYDNLNFWGWAFLGWGILQIAAGGLVFMRRTLGAAIGVALAMTACILWFFMLFVSPWGMLVGIIVNTTILVGLTRDRHGEEQWHSVYD